MVKANPFIAALIEQSASGYAAAAASRLLEASPETAARFAPTAFSMWRGQLTTQLQQLAIALADGEPELFADRIAWSRAAFDARAVPVDDLRSSLECLLEVLEAELPNDQLEALPDYFTLALATLEGEGQVGASELPPHEPAAGLCASYLQSALQFDRERACDHMLTAVDAGTFTVHALLTEVLPAIQREIGLRWHLGRVSVAQEHFATETCRDLVARISQRAPCAEAHGTKVIVGSVAGNLHDLGPAIAAHLFKLDGWDVIYLGANIPADDLASIVASVAPAAAILGATLIDHRRTVTETIAALRVEAPELPVIIGGPAFDPATQAWRRTGATAFATSAEDALRIANATVRAS